MALTLTITDLANGTGATATVAGATGTATVYVQTFAGDLTAGLWSVGGSRSGAGDLTLSLSIGHYFAYVAADGAVSPVVYFTATDGVESVEHRIDLAVQARLRLLGLAGMNNERIVVRDVPTNRNLTNPCIVVSSARQIMDPMRGVLHLDDVGYVEQVTIFDDENQSHANGSKYKLWLQKIARAFRNNGLTGVDEVITCKVTPGEPIPPIHWLASKYVGILLLEFTARETRGF